MKESVLKLLREEGRISGEELGQRLNISRTAVWKQVNYLRKRGYRIDSSTRTGYSFIKGPDLLLPEEIIPGLGTEVLGNQILYREEATSTQNIAEEMARGGVEEGLVVIAEKQTAGRGRKGRGWVSPPRAGIYFSTLLRPNLRPQQLLQIPLIAGVAVSRAIKKTTPLQPKIKWPNDVLIEGKKVCGILAEMSSELDRVNHVIVGIGVNVNTPKTLFPGPMREVTSSLAEECGEYVSRVRFLQALLTEFEALYGQFQVSGFQAIRDEWKALNNTIGSWVKVNDGKDEIRGKALDIDKEGFLLVREEHGDVMRIVSGDVSLTNPDS